ncbi:FAD-binding oxidoreductase [Actinomadura sp. WMMB 499]|uniref:FAD-binding oxidoreductase n=1 Tax=Actinomadura sp. WMMB 499 TaxID=1219491 RepID=UPI0012447B07|nr:FAD-binding oxidoreductase [Actinomadura sp. WMMB 499]QFG24011.1 FAD-binding oxidoreductase [Actinomadura sp. WMMB 499]
MTIHKEADLREGFAGEVILPRDPGYDEARALFNGMIDRRPAVIAQCANTDDVARAIGFARERGLEVSVRGGGHGVAGKALADGGLVVDLRMLNSVTIDPRARTVRVGGGATMAELDRAAAEYSLATTGGRVSTTGVGGFVLGGGSGWLERKFGLACDNLVSVELVAADGTHLRASEEENPELFWALHGGGGNFGVATSFTMRLHPLPAVSVALLLWPEAAGPEILRAYRDFMASAPDEVGGGALYMTAPPEDFVPDDLVGRRAFAFLLTYTGTGSRANGVIGPMTRLGHAGGLQSEMSYADLQCMLDDPPGYRNYWSAEHLRAFPDDAVARFCEMSANMVIPSPSQQVLFPEGGAVARGPEYPIPWRKDPWVVHPFGLWDDPADDARAVAWAHGLREAMRPWSTGAVYLNFIGDEGADRVREGLGEENLRRLAEVKRRYDPDNVFHHNQNIRPAAA